MNYIPTKWETRFLTLADTIANWSKDASTKVGAVIIGDSREVISTGYNGFPRGVKDDLPSRNERPTKYIFTEHAERNAIYNAARMGAKLEGTAMFCTLMPCVDCARAIIQSGIVLVVTRVPQGEMSNEWHFEATKQMFQEANVCLAEVNELH